MNRSTARVITGLPTSLLACALALGACTGTVGDDGAEEGAAPGGPVVGGPVCERATVGPPVLRRLSAVELENSLRDIFPEISAAWAGVRLGPDPLSKLGFSNDAQSLTVGNQTAEELLHTAENVADLVTAEATLPAILPCAAADPSDACAGELVDAMGLRLFRRPVTGEERAELLSLFASLSARADFRRGLKWTLVAMIQSPQAVYRSEIGEMRDGRYELTPYEVATELSYSFGGTTPSRELLDKAASGALDTDEARVDEARRLLATPRGREALHRFFSEWLGYGRIRGKAKSDVENFAATGDLMIEETRRLLDEIVYSREAGVRELLTAPYTFVNADLARFYGYGQVTGDFSLVERPEAWGVGLLAQGSVLAGHAHMDSSSPTQRGLLVYERLLCNDVPPPPANIPPIEPPEPGVTTTRARYESVHTKNDGCNACHGQFDPSGFALEHFDETGRYRADEGGLPIDDAGYVSFKDGKAPVAGPMALAEALASSRQVVECVTNLAAAYAYGGATGAECAVGEAREGLWSEAYGLLEYFARLAGTEHTRYREPGPR